MKRIIRDWNEEEKYISEDYAIAFQDTIRKAKKEKDMSHSVLAEILGVSRSRVSQLFMDGNNPSIRYVGLVLYRLGYTIGFKKISTKCLLRE